MKPVLNRYFADFHIHVGVDEEGRWVKIPTSKHLTVRNIIQEAAERKGLDIVGIIDALSPLVQNDLTQLVDEGLLQLQPGGGYRYEDRLTLLLGAEIETCEDNGGLAHTLVYLPDLVGMRDFSRHMSRHIRNINMSSQNAHMPLRQLVTIASGFEAAIIPAHVFTPHKSLYGACARRLGEILPEREFAKITAIELGLSADADLADSIQELTDFVFLSNSDAHSLAKIGREYNSLCLESPNFMEVILAFVKKEGRKVDANYGLDPRLGKYHRTYCSLCGYTDSQMLITAKACSQCGSDKIICGVYDRIRAIADHSVPMHPSDRAPYFYQIPLQFIPGLGEKSLKRLLDKFQTEMNIIHQVPENELLQVLSAEVADVIIGARKGKIPIISGAGGIYGRVRR